MWPDDDSLDDPWGKMELRDPINNVGAIGMEEESMKMCPTRDNHGEETKLWEEAWHAKQKTQRHFGTTSCMLNCNTNLILH